MVAVRSGGRPAGGRTGCWTGCSSDWTGCSSDWAGCWSGGAGWWGDWWSGTPLEYPLRAPLTRAVRRRSSAVLVTVPGPQLPVLGRLRDLRTEGAGRVGAEDPQVGREEGQLLQRQGDRRVLRVTLDVRVELGREE